MKKFTNFISFYSKMSVFMAFGMFLAFQGLFAAQAANQVAPERPNPPHPVRSLKKQCLKALAYSSQLKNIFSPNLGDLTEEFCQVLQPEFAKLIDAALSNDNDKAQQALNALKQLNRGIINQDILERQRPNNHTALSYVAMTGGEDKIEILQILLNLGANPNKVIKHGKTPLHFVISSGQANFVQQLDNRQINFVQMLLQHGANPDTRDQYSQTPLHWAVNLEDTNFVQMLLNHRANPNASDRYDQVPLHLAINNKENNLAQLLLQHDPHIWFDVQLWIQVVEHISTILQKHIPEHAYFYRTYYWCTPLSEINLVQKI